MRLDQSSAFTLWTSLITSRTERDKFRFFCTSFENETFLGKECEPMRWQLFF